jgi:hypothetical protein
MSLIRGPFWSLGDYILEPRRLLAHVSHSDTDTNIPPAYRCPSAHVPDILKQLQSARYY